MSFGEFSFQDQDLHFSEAGMKALATGSGRGTVVLSREGRAQQPQACQPCMPQPRKEGSRLRKSPWEKPCLENTLFVFFFSNLGVVSIVGTGTQKHIILRFIQ